MGGALGTQLRLWRGCKGKKRQRQHSPHHSTASPDRGAWPWLSSSAHAGTDPARPRRRLARLFLATTFSVQLSARYHDFIICLPGDPQLPRLRHRYLEGALPLWKKKKQPNLLMALHRCLLGLSKPYSISKPSISWAPWEEPWVPVPSGCLHLLGDNMVPKKRDGQK